MTLKERYGETVRGIFIGAPTPKDHQVTALLFCVGVQAAVEAFQAGKNLDSVLEELRQIAYEHVPPGVVVQ